MHRAVRIAPGIVGLSLFWGCSKGEAAGDLAPEMAAMQASAVPIRVEAPPPPPAARRAAPPAAKPMDPSRYAWLPGTNAPAPVDTLEQRFAPRPGFRRVALAPESFGAFLRALPLAAPGTPVRSNTGRVIHDAKDRRLAAVVALD